MRDKDKDYRDNYMKSFIHRSKFRSRTLARFKKGVMTLNSNKKPVQEKTKAVREQEKMKHEQNKRAAEKRGLPTFNRQDAQKLLAGKYHDDEEEEDEVECMEQSLFLLPEAFEEDEGMLEEAFYYIDDPDVIYVPMDIDCNCEFSEEYTTAICKLWAAT